MIETSSFVSFLKIREKWSESKATAKTKGTKYLLVSINPHGLSLLYGPNVRKFLRGVISKPAHAHLPSESLPPSHYKLEHGYLEY